ncbi:bola-like protein [Paraphysoderma sedebokerense]|nr:bola-like protein [Paraphysoderma sedebokerense]
MHLRSILSPTIRHTLAASRPRLYSSVPTQKFETEGEQQVFKKLLNSELKPTSLQVVDTSGGCGTMYAINIKSPAFKGLGMLQQHRKVNEVLKDEIPQWHGLQLVTGVEAESSSRS